MTLANLQSLLARTQNPVQRADIQAGITQAQREIAVLRKQLPLLCAPPAPHPSLNVLIVLDGTDVSFGTPDTSAMHPDGYFTLSYFQSVLQTQGVTTAGLPIVLTRAHRQQDAALPVAPDTVPSGVLNNAYFTWKSNTVPADVMGPKTVVDLSQFHVILLFGFVSMNPDALAWDGGHGEDQLWAFVQFMNNGGGLFATGDHEDLGAPLCAALPRVRTMRRWLWLGPDPSDPNQLYGVNFVNDVVLVHTANRPPYDKLGMHCAPPSVGSVRLDTLQAPPQAQLQAVYDPNAKRTYTPGATAQTDSPIPYIPFDRQSDDIPQPVTFTQPGQGHPLFALPGGGQLSVYPDHMHEGMATDLTDTTDPDPRTVSYTHQGVTIQEFPQTAAAQPVPEILMTLSTTSGHATPSGETYHIGSGDPSVHMTFGGVCAYDGSPVGVGRIVTDSTFHHFVDINLIGDSGVVAAGNEPAYAAHGFQGSTTGQGYLAQFAAYWLNLVHWLAGPRSAPAALMAAVEQARQSVSVRKVAGAGAADHGEAVHDLGATAAQLMTRQLPAPMLRDTLHQAMPDAHARGVARWLADAGTTDPQRAADVDRILTNGFIGGAVLHSLTLPREQNLASDAETVAGPVVQAGLAGAAKALDASSHRDTVGDLVTLLRAQPAGR